MYFIVKTGYGKNDFISIDNLNDVEKAQGAFLTNSKTIFENGRVCRGQDIIDIREDWHKEMGWNATFRDENGDIQTHELGDDDWADIKRKGVDKKYIGVLAGIKDKVKYLIDTKQAELIGKGVDIQLPEKPKEISALAEKMRIK